CSVEPEDVVGGCLPHGLKVSDNWFTCLGIYNHTTLIIPFVCNGFNLWKDFSFYGISTITTAILSHGNFILPWLHFIYFLLVVRIVDVHIPYDITTLNDITS